MPELEGVDEAARGFGPFGWVALIIMFIVVLYLAAQALWGGTQFDPAQLLREVMGPLVSWMMSSLKSSAMKMTTLGG